MGCDIHFYVERRVDGVWVEADRWTPSEYEEDQGALRVRYEDAYTHDRNYDLFSMLANVRNGHGFAGVPTGEGFVPIAMPRGLPEDVSPLVRQASDVWDGDGHSHSYLTVAELMAYDWTQTTTKCGVVSINELARWRIEGHPQSWSGGISGGGIKTIEVTNGLIASIDATLMEHEADWWTLWHMPELYGLSDDRLTPKQLAVMTAIRQTVGAERPYFFVKWQVSYFEPASRFLSRVLPRLWRLGRPEDVRIVFWFDN